MASLQGCYKDGQHFSTYNHVVNYKDTAKFKADTFYFNVKSGPLLQLNKKLLKDTISSIDTYYVIKIHFISIL